MIHPSMNAEQILDREFLEMRAKVLELAASFDRIERAEGAVSQDPRVQKLRAALDVVTPSLGDADRAEQVQRIFSREYDPNWRQNFQLG